MSNEPAQLTHLDGSGRARMVDVGDKQPGRRAASARATVRVSPETAAKVQRGDAPKGDVLGVEGVLDATAGTITLTAEAHTTGPTGVEMEAMTAAAVAALTVYDMVKGIDRSAEIAEVTLLEKSGGRSGVWRRD